MEIITDIIYNEHGQVLDVHTTDKDPDAVFVYFHGGGLEEGSKDANFKFAEYLTKHNVAVVDANYRMYPDAKYPDFIEDAADVVAWTFEHIKEYVNCDKIYVAGTSAGGYLTMMLCFDERYLEKRGINVNDIAGFVHDAGQPTVHFNVLREYGLDTRRVIIDERAPLYYIGANGNEAPPMFFFVSDNDMENRYEQIQLTLSTLRHFGYDMNKIYHRVMHGRHCAYVSAIDENGDSIFGKIVREFISDTL